MDKEHLEDLKNQGLITEEEYQIKINELSQPKRGLMEKIKEIIGTCLNFITNLTKNQRVIAGSALIVAVSLLVIVLVLVNQPSWGLEYEEHDDGYYVSGIGTCTDKNIVIPTTHNGLPVIGIKYGAFRECTQIKSVKIPNSVTSIGDYAFDYCESLKNVYYQGAFEDWCNINFYGGSSNPCCNGGDLYIQGELLTNAVIPDTLTSIKYQFTGCTSLVSITIPNSITSIGNYAFYGCISLTSITIPNGVTSIGYRTFNGCSSLTSVTIPNSVTSIGDQTFDGCTSLEYNEYGGAYYLGNSSNPYLVLVKAKRQDITSCFVNSHTKIIYEYAFYGCTSLKYVTIPDSVTSIGNSAFSGCTSLLGIMIPDSVTSIGAYAFYNCTSLERFFYSSTKTRWNAISKGYNWNDSTGWDEIVCWDGNIQK